MSQPYDMKWLRTLDRPTLTRREVAGLLGCDPRTVSTAIQEGSIKALKIGRRVLIPREPLIEQLSSKGEA